MGLFSRLKESIKGGSQQAAAASETTQEPELEKTGFFGRLKESLTKTRQSFVEKIDNLVHRHKAIDEDLYEELEEILVQADVGVNTAMELVEKTRRSVKERRVDDAGELKAILKEHIREMLGTDTASLNITDETPTVIMVVGVNGVGKTTTIGKLAHYYKSRGAKVLLGAADTFRAAAIDQLEIWAERVGVEIIKHREGADPAAVAFDSLQAAKARRADLLIVDTAGRLHTKANLMEELKKISRVLGREMAGAPHEVLLILDATTGQNAVNQARLFGEAVGITGIALTKLDGSSKGGVIIAVKQALDIPVKLIGIGESLEDLRPFSPGDFADALFDE
ncbi:signal recognition particle-docking protein FtsY [Pelotomaculum propionicicum]|uniref:Signal recognition particle receptor FtsY n=1 Tax=Pelotomaculum propionicicum TaxID=258475 RepID=A0A4Y7RSW6_9FIRM|nr:signal recognition particle-docking protein FtsY [Pelotomaculum propionicicum]NLI13288.1 signal recognition particle-docking protein FtsY [Peptococcaceae bacterium]TEB12075.1 Signal recognition particle receptor FtsY [Pelotomaculum propionicicum]